MDDIGVGDLGFMLDLDEISYILRTIVMVLMVEINSC